MREYSFERATKQGLKAALRNLSSTLKVLGVRGKNWIKGDYNNRDGQFCLMGAAAKANGIGEWVAKDALFQVVESSKKGRFYSVEDWNDRRARKWSEVRRLILRTQKLIEKKLAAKG